MSRHYQSDLAFVTFFTLLIACPVFAIESERRPDFGIIDNPPFCQCSNFASCTRKPFRSSSPMDKQVIIVSDGRETWQNWRWDVLSTVISYGKPDKNLMCYSHMKGKGYGFTTHVSNFSALVDGEDLVWISKRVHEARNHFVDYLVVDILPVLEEESVNITRLTSFMRHLKYSLSQHAYGSKMLCLLPWNPEKFGSGLDLLDLMVDSLLKYCDGFVTNSNSYLSPKTEACKARPLVPFTKLAYGLDEFMSHGIPIQKFFMGVPWHGFDYTCESYDKSKNICTLKKTEDETCDYEAARKKITLGDMAQKFPDSVATMRNHSWEKFVMAPYFTFEENGKTHQLWFEDHHSLVVKYHLVQDMEMSGVVIWSGDDLNYDTNSWTQVYDKSMWNLLHQLMTEKRRASYITDQINSFPSKMAGVGVGCMLLGTVIGFVIGIVVCIRRSKTTLRAPFTKDRMQEYTDEDPGM